MLKHTIAAVPKFPNSLFIYKQYSLYTASAARKEKAAPARPVPLSGSGKTQNIWFS
jgi:hypothetical protein